MNQLLSNDWPVLASKPPLSTWETPRELPTIRDFNIAIDTETRDQGLENSRGTGWVYHQGYLTGVSVAWQNNAIYVPIRHPDSECFQLNTVIKWVEDLFRYNRINFFNAGYDCGWLKAEGVQIWPHKMDDASVMSSLIDENWDTNGLEACCARAGIPGKDEELFEQACRAYGIKKINGSYKHGLWRLPARFVGPYAEADAIATLELSNRLKPLIVEQELESAYQTEIKLIRVVYEMRRRGIRIDEDAAVQAQARCDEERDVALARIRPPTDRRPVVMEDLRSPTRLAAIFDAVGVTYPRTAKTGQPSFTAEWLEDQETPIAAAVRAARKLDDISSKFLGNYILGFAHLGRLHAEVHPLRTDDGGTVTSRFAYSNPPLPQIPARDPVLGPLVRRIFLPERGAWWFAPDLSQQEYRLAVHFASVCRIRGAAESVAYYRERGERADFHQLVADMAGIPRPRAKIINLGLLYGMGIQKLARSLGLSVEDATELMTVYHGKVPWVKLLSEFVDRRAQARGYIKLIDGARRHFDEWEPSGRREEAACRQPLASQRWPNRPLRRAYTRKAMNSLIQGSAARQVKIAMVNCYEAGELPLLQIHDELCFSVEGPRPCKLITQLMRDAVQLHVPMLVDPDVGPSWGEAKTNYERFDWRLAE